jgi:hypothetical protein
MRGPGRERPRRSGAPSGGPPTGTALRGPTGAPCSLQGRAPRRQRDASPRVICELRTTGRRRAAAQDFDLGGGFHYSGSYPMVFQHSGARPRAERSRVRAKEPPAAGRRQPRAGSGSRHARQEGSPHPVWLCRQDGLWWATHRTAAARRTLAGPARPRSAPPPRLDPTGRIERVG